MKNEIKTGMKFIDGNGITHTIKEIDNERVIHSYECDGINVTDGYMYRTVFEKLLKNGVITII